MGQFNVTMPDGSVRSVQGTTAAAAANNAGGGAVAGGTISSSPTSVKASTPTVTSSTNTSSGANSGTVYNTVNGPKTPTQMMNELYAAGWNGQGEIKDTYARTTGGAVSPASPGTAATGAAPAGTPGAPGAGPIVSNVGADKNLMDAANAAANQAYLSAKLGLDTDDLAFRKATQAFTNALNEAAVTGKYNGQETQAAQAQQFGQGITAAGVTGMYNGAPTLAAQAQQQKTANDYLTLISNLKGPADYGSYLRTLGSTPGGMRDLVSSAAGAYAPASGSTSGAAPVGASLGGLLGDTASGSAGGTSYADYMKTASGVPAPNQIAPAAWNAYTSSQKQMLLGMYGQQGWDTQDVQDLYAQSLPKYSYSPGTTGTVKV